MVSRGAEAAVVGRVLVPGNAPADGPLLRLRAPLSFWGGIDARAGTVSDPRHPDHGISVAGKVLAVPAAVGSSSSSAIMLELLREGTAPVALILGKADAIVALGVVVAGELGHATISVVEAPWEEIAALPEGHVRVDTDGTIRARPP